MVVHSYVCTYSTSRAEWIVWPTTLPFSIRIKINMPWLWNIDRMRSLKALGSSAVLYKKALILG